MWALKIWNAVSWIVVLYFLAALLFSGGLFPADINFYSGANEEMRRDLLLAVLHAVSLTLVIRILKPLAKEPPLPPPSQANTEPWDEL